MRGRVRSRVLRSLLRLLQGAILCGVVLYTVCAAYARYDREASAFYGGWQSPSEGGVRGRKAARWAVVLTRSTV